MKKLSAPTRRALIRTAYLMPAISGLILLIYGCIPHLFYLYENVAYDTLSTFSLMSNTFSECCGILRGTTEGSQEALLFAYAMTFFVILFWIALIAYAITAVASAVCSTYAFSHEPTAQNANRAKRWMQFFCPNRIFYVINNLLVLIPAAFPHILLYFYYNQFGYLGMSVHFFGPSDILLAAILVLLNLASFLALLPAQASEHMDMFRLYKKK